MSDNNNLQADGTLNCGARHEDSGTATGTGESKDKGRAKDKAKRDAQEQAFQAAVEVAQSIKCRAECPKKKVTISVCPSSEPVEGDCVERASYNEEYGFYTKRICSSRAKWSVVVECVEGCNNEDEGGDGHGDNGGEGSGEGH